MQTKLFNIHKTNILFSTNIPKKKKKCLNTKRNLNSLKIFNEIFWLVSI